MTEHFHPITLITFFAFTIILPACTGNPLFFCMTLITGFFMLCSVLGIRSTLKSLPGYLILFIVIAIFNPLFYHDGNTVLFYLNRKRVTFEALAYGINSSLMVTGILIWCRSFTYYMTSDRIMYLFGSFSPRTAVIISMILRLVPMYRDHIVEYRNTQRLLGIYGGGTFLERVRAEFKMFGGFLTYILEHSMTTSDSMTSRGYGTARRTNYRLFRFKPVDLLLILVILAAATFIIYATVTGTFSTVFYPDILLPKCTLKMIIALSLHTVIAVIPPVCEIIFAVICKNINPEINHSARKN